MLSLNIDHHKKYHLALTCRVTVSITLMYFYGSVCLSFCMPLLLCMVLTYTSRCDNVHCVEALIHASTHETNDCDVDGRTPLLLAAAHGNHQVVQVLLSLGADISSRYASISYHTIPYHTIPYHTILTILTIPFLIILTHTHTPHISTAEHSPPHTHPHPHYTPIQHPPTPTHTPTHTHTPPHTHTVADLQLGGGWVRGSQLPRWNPIFSFFLFNFNATVHPTPIHIPPPPPECQPSPVGAELDPPLAATHPLTHTQHFYTSTHPTHPLTHTQHFYTSTHPLTHSTYAFIPTQPHNMHARI